MLVWVRSFIEPDVLKTMYRSTMPLQFTVKPVFFACPLFREFREPGKFAKITGRENLNTVAFQCIRKQKCQNYGVQNN